MNKMVRKQFFISAEQNRRLKKGAAAAGVSEAALIRDGIDLRLEQKQEVQNWRVEFDKLSGAWAERTDLDELLRSNRRGWKRRLKRLGLSSGKP